MADFNGVPGGAELWRIDGRVHLVYFVPPELIGDGPPVPMLWYIDDPAEVDALFGPGESVRFDREMTAAEAAALGAVPSGNRSEIRNTLERPFDRLVNTFAQEAAIRPWLRDPEVLRNTAAALIEGRHLSDAELMTTEWWQSRTDSERARIEAAAGDPASFARDQADWEIRVRDQLVKLGYGNPPDSLVTYYAQQVNTGKLSETQLVDALRRETDPYAPGASPFAGYQLPEGAAPVRRGDEWFIRTEQGDYRMTGPGQVARFGQDAQQLAPQATYYTDGQRHALKMADGTWRVADGPGQIAEMQRIYGSPQVVPATHIGTSVGNVVGAFRTDDPTARMEDFTAGTINEVGTAAQLFEGQERDLTELGGEEDVRRLLLQWLGPMFGGNYSEEWIAEQAGKIRNGGPGATDVLVQYLRETSKALFPKYDEGLPYEAIAAPWRGLYQRYAGQLPNEATDPVFHRVLNANDAVEAELILRSEGMERGWSAVLDESLAGWGANVGSNVIGSAA